MELAVTRPDGSTVTRTYVFQVGCSYLQPLLPEDVASLLQPGTNLVSVRLYDICGVSGGTGTGIYLSFS